MKKILLLLTTLTLAATSLIAAPQAVVFDFGGVMTKESDREAVVHFVRQSLHLSEKEFEKATQEKRLALKQGSTDEEFWTSYAKNKGVKLPSDWAEQFRSVLKKAININTEMYALVDELKGKKIPVAMLSNIDDRLAELIRNLDLYKPFEPCLLSCEIGVQKPDLKAYELLLARLKLPAAEVVFIDDKAENIEAAKKLGIDAILFESTDQIRNELKKRDTLSCQ